jgi:hypothetical protein
MGLLLAYCSVTYLAYLLEYPVSAAQLGLAQVERPGLFKHNRDESRYRSKIVSGRHARVVGVEIEQYRIIGSARGYRT